MELEAKRVGSIAMAGEPVASDPSFILFDLVLALSPLIIEMKDVFGLTAAIGNDEPNVGSQWTNFNLDQNPSSLVPASGPVPKAIEPAQGSLGAGILALGFFDPALSLLLEHRVGSDADGIQDIERFQGAVNVWSRRSGISPVADLSVRETGFNEGYQALQLSSDSR